MKTAKINENEIKEASVASLPTRPTAPSAFGGRGYTAKDMKEAFDKLPMLIAERFNSLIDDILAPRESSIAASMATDIEDGHTLSMLFEDITSGGFSAYLSVMGKPLVEYLTELEDRIDELESTLNRLI